MEMKRKEQTSPTNRLPNLIPASEHPLGISKENLQCHTECLESKSPKLHMISYLQFEQLIVPKVIIRLPEMDNFVDSVKDVYSSPLDNIEFEKCCISKTSNSLPEETHHSHKTSSCTSRSRTVPKKPNTYSITINHPLLLFLVLQLLFISIQNHLSKLLTKVTNKVSSFPLSLKFTLKSFNDVFNISKLGSYSSRISTHNYRTQCTVSFIIILMLSPFGNCSEFPDRECCDSAPPPPPFFHTTTSTTPVPPSVGNGIYGPGGSTYAPVPGVGIGSNNGIYTGSGYFYGSPGFGESNQGSGNTIIHTTGGGDSNQHIVIGGGDIGVSGTYGAGSGGKQPGMHGTHYGYGKNKAYPGVRVIGPDNTEYKIPPSALEPTDQGDVSNVRNCLLSRAQCAEDAACRSILAIIPRVCGPESVSCSTVTVNKCLAALRTLQGFPYFQPTCLCREPHLDLECNNFHSFIFDHPCTFVKKNAGSSPYAVHALPICEYALNVCKNRPDCIPLYSNFMRACRVQNGLCHMTSSEQCLGAWSMLKKSPMFGCICPNNNNNENCTRIFEMIHQNPCVDTISVSSAPNLVSLSGSGGKQWSIMFPPPPPTPRPTQRPSFHSRPHPRPPLPPILPPSPLFPPQIDIEHMPRPHPPPPHPYQPPHHTNYLPPHATAFTPPYLTAMHPYPPPLHSSQTHNVLSVAEPTQNSYPWSFPVNVIPFVNASHQQQRHGQRGGHHSPHLTNPLIPPPYSPNRGASPPAPAGPPATKNDNSRAASVLGNSGGAFGRSIDGAMSAASSSGAPRQSLTSSSNSRPIDTLMMTCQSSLTGCMADRKCKKLMDGVLARCDENSCHQMACMDNLQRFYRNVDTKWAMDVAFCLCKKTSLTADACLDAQEKLHPTCARKPQNGNMILCHQLAMNCKTDPSCRHRLEYYEQACAVDSDTQRCAGSTSECRKALTGILGTELRVMCSCATISTRETYLCVDWQRILWFNPCVVESQTDYHREMLMTFMPGTIELTTSPNIVYPPQITTEILSEPVQQISHGQQGGTVLNPTKTTSWEPITNPPTTTTTTRKPTTTTMPPNYCEKHQPGRKGVQDYIVEEGGKRFYTKADPSCSELCMCHSGKQLVCNVLQCTVRKPCETNVAIYSHAAPAFIAFRGECLCYSGSFICVRPETIITEDGEETQVMYDSGRGIFMFIGFSEADEDLLNPYTHLTVADSIKELQYLLEEAAIKVNERKNEVTDGEPVKYSEVAYCQLSLHEVLKQNLIVRVTLPEFDDQRDNMTAAMYHKEKENCMESVELVVHKITIQAPEIRSSIVMSMLWVAGVHVDIPDKPAGAPSIHSAPPLLFILLWIACHSAFVRRSS